MYEIPEHNKNLQSKLHSLLNSPKTHATDILILDFYSFKFTLSIKSTDKENIIILFSAPFIISSDIPSKETFLLTSLSSLLEASKLNTLSPNFKIEIEQISKTEAKFKFPIKTSNLEIASISSFFTNLPIKLTLKTFQHLIPSNSDLNSQSNKDQEGQSVHFDLDSKTTFFALRKPQTLVLAFGLYSMEKIDTYMAAAFVNSLAERSRQGAAKCPPASFEPPTTEKRSKASIILKGIDERELERCKNGFVLFYLNLGGEEGKEKMERKMEKVVGFKRYLDFHVKATRTCLNGKMREVSGEMGKVLNRAYVIP